MISQVNSINARQVRAYINPKGGRSPRFSGEDGIRTRDTRSGTPGFQAGA